MITAHVTKTAFPYWDSMWMWIVFGALDGHAEALFGMYVPLHTNNYAILTDIMTSTPLVQSTHNRQVAFVFLSLALSIFSYGRFCTYVIKDITEYLGIACFTVR